MQEAVFARSGWFPRVVRSDDGLRLQLGAGADALHQPRTFSFPISEEHLGVMRDDLARHLLLWCAVLPLCDAAGIRDALDEDASVALLEPVLLGTPEQVDALFREKNVDTMTLVRYGADVELLERGQVVESLHSATEHADHLRAQTYFADRQRARRGVHLAPLDEAVLKYVGHYVHGSTLPGRHPDAVDPALLDEVLGVIATAERASAGMRIQRDPRRGKRSTDKRDWERMAEVVKTAVRREHPDLVDDALRSVSFLVCSEAAARTKDLPVEDVEPPTGVAGGPLKARLIFTDEQDHEKTWQVGGARSAGVEFWEFVADHVGSRNQVFTIEDEALGEGIQLHFHADSAARITTAVEGKDGVDPEYRVEYGLVDGMDGYRALLGAFVRGGCAALDQHGPWMLDFDEFEAARRRRDAETTFEQSAP